MTSADFITRLAQGERLELEDEFGFHTVQAHRYEQGYYQVDFDTDTYDYDAIVKWFGVRGGDDIFFFPRGEGAGLC